MGLLWWWALAAFTKSLKQHKLCPDDQNNCKQSWQFHGLSFYWLKLNIYMFPTRNQVLTSSFNFKYHIASRKLLASHLLQYNVSPYLKGIILGGWAFTISVKVQPIFNIELFSLSLSLSLSLSCFLRSYYVIFNFYFRLLFNSK